MTPHSRRGPTGAGSGLNQRIELAGIDKTQTIAPHLDGADAPVAVAHLADLIERYWRSTISAERAMHEVHLVWSCWHLESLRLLTAA